MAGNSGRGFGLGFVNILNTGDLRRTFGLKKKKKKKKKKRGK